MMKNKKGFAGFEVAVVGFVFLIIIAITLIPVFVDSVDRKLRNDIAHLNFRVMFDGRIVDKRTGNELAGFGEKMQYLRWICTLVGCTFDYLFWKCKDPTYE